MATIEKRLDKLQSAHARIRNGLDYTADNLHMRTAAIVEPWNGALAAMKAVVAHHDAGPFCPQCGQTDGLHRASCFVTLLQAALATMGGTE